MSELVKKEVVRKPVGAEKHEVRNGTCGTVDAMGLQICQSEGRKIK